MLSRTGLYALRAMVHLAGAENGSNVSAGEVAAALDMPPDYLAKTLRSLAKEGLLTSSRGAGGGYRMARDPASVTLAEVVSPFQPSFAPGICLLEDRPCDPAHPCRAHSGWSEWTRNAQRMLERTTLADLLGGTPPYWMNS